MSFGYEEDEYVLDDVDLTIEPGDYVAVMGENGAGKTTLVRHFNGLLKPDEGSVRVDGRSTEKWKISELSQTVGMVFQYPESMFFSESVEDEVAFALKNFGLDKPTIERRVHRFLGVLGLDGYEERSPFTLSGGEQRRLALACVLAWDPKYIVLDEPTAGQDRFQRDLLIDIVSRLRERGKGVVIVSHDVEFVAETAPYVYLLSDGRKIAQGNSTDVLSNRRLVGEAGLILPQIADFLLRISPEGQHLDSLSPREAARVVMSMRDR